MMFLVAFSLIFFYVNSEIYFRETFDEGFDNWVYSDDKSVTHGTFFHGQRQYCPEGDLAIKSQNDSSYYHLSSHFSKPFDTTKHPLYLLYTVQYTQNIGCGGGYIKVFPKLDQKAFTGLSPYGLMIGPDVCGSSTQTLHFIISHKGTNHPLKESQGFSPDTNPHLIELYVGTDRKFQLSMDNEIKLEGSLDDHFNYLPPKMIDDPESKKPEDWVDEPLMADPDDTKPEDWDDRQNIPDPDSTKPDNWDDETDGEFEPDFIKNPNFKGKWTPKQIPNPNFKGKWEPKQIPNPDYSPDNTFFDFTFDYIGIDLWTVEAGTLFDDFLVTDSSEEANAHKELVLAKIKESIEKKKAEQPKVDDPTPDSGDVEPDEPEIDEGDDKEDL